MGGGIKRCHLLVILHLVNVFWVFCNDCISCLITTRDQLPMFVKMTKLLNTNLLSIYISSRITFLFKGPFVICLSFFCVQAFGISYSCFQYFFLINKIREFCKKMLITLNNKLTSTCVRIPVCSYDKIIKTTKVSLRALAWTSLRKRTSGHFLKITLL